MKHYEKRRSVSSKMFVMMLALVLVFGCAVGGTIAWLTATSATVENTFTYGDINIELTETMPKDQQAKIIPGVDIEKDPKVTVKAGSEACWLFVKVEDSGKFADDVTYDIETGWTKLTGVEGVDNVYYREVDAVTVDTHFYVLKDNKVTVKDTLTKDDLQELKKNNNGTIPQPTLTFTAYAVQKDGMADAATAWKAI